MDADGGGLAQGTIASVELAEGDGRSLGGAATGFCAGVPLPPPFFDRLLGQTGVLS